MSNNTQPPFAIEQKVVCIDSSVYYNTINKVADVLTVGETYTVLGMRKVCCYWEINVGAQAKVGAMVLCRECKQQIPFIDGVWWFNHTRFAPVQHNYTDITASLATQPVEERLDVPRIKEPVLS